MLDEIKNNTGKYPEVLITDAGYGNRTNYRLLDKQKKGKKRMKNVGKISLNQEAFLAVLKR